MSIVVVTLPNPPDVFLLDNVREEDDKQVRRVEALFPDYRSGPTGMLVPGYFVKYWVFFNFKNGRSLNIISDGKTWSMGKGDIPVHGNVSNVIAGIRQDIDDFIHDMETAPVRARQMNYDKAKNKSVMLTLLFKDARGKDDFLSFKGGLTRTGSTVLFVRAGRSDGFPLPDYALDSIMTNTPDISAVSLGTEFSMSLALPSLPTYFKDNGPRGPDVQGPDD